MLRSVIVAALLLSPTLGAAAKYGTYPRLEVNQLQDGRYEVIEAAGFGQEGVWCAAGEYAIRALGLNRGRIYVDRPSGPALTRAGRKGIIFTTEVVAQQKSGSSSVRDRGSNLLIGHAVQFCADRSDRDDIWKSR
ncbi:MAG: hypothetical protein AAF729_06360 [Pseudomonadota bacterium]